MGSEFAIQDGGSDVDDPYNPRRTILVTGDGAFGLTMQEIGTMITNKLAPIIFIINNAGYTVERIIHGARQPYNDINTLRYEHLLSLFSHPEPQNYFHRCTNRSELTSVLASLPITRPQHTTVVEIVMDPFDVPWEMSAVISLRGPAKIQTLRDEGFSGWTEGGFPQEWVKAEEIVKDLGA